LAHDRRTKAERLTVRFLLSVWDRQLAWEQDPFNVMDALLVWDLEDRVAFLN
jgi:hypothetical protein